MSAQCLPSLSKCKVSVNSFEIAKNFGSLCGHLHFRVVVVVVVVLVVVVLVVVVVAVVVVAGVEVVVVVSLAYGFSLVVVVLVVVIVSTLEFTVVAIVGCSQVLFLLSGIAKMCNIIVHLTFIVS